MLLFSRPGGPVPRRRRTAAAGLAATLALATAALLAVATTATTWSASARNAEPGRRTFTVGITQDIDSLNPFTGIVSSAYELYQLGYDTLTDYGQADFSPKPSLATSWDVSDNGLTWTYHIRPGVKWSDGQPLTARDVAYTFNRVMANKYEQTNYGTYVEALTSVEATDDQTVVMKVKKPTPVMLHLYLYVLPEHVWKDVDEKAVKNFANEPGAGGIVGSGPFTVKEHKKGQFVRLERNPHYWGEQPKIDGLVFRIFQNQDSLAQALRRGEIDFADDLGANVFNSLKNAPGVTTYPARYSGFDEIAMNVGAALDDGTPIGDGHPALEDKRVRVAIAHAIDTKAVTERVFGGYGTPGTSVIPSLYRALHYDPGATAYAFDPDEANRLLDKAGYRKGAGGIRTMPDGSRPLRFRLLGRSSSQTSKQTVQFVQDWLADIGIDVTTKIVSEDALTEIIGEGKFDLFEWGWVVEPDPNYQLSTFACANRSYKDGGNVYANLSDSFYCNKRYDALFQRQAHQIDAGQRAETVRAMQKMLYDDAPYVVTTYYDDLQAYRSDRFTNFQPQPEPNGSLLFQYGTYSYRSLQPVTEKAKQKAAEDSGSGSGLVVAASLGGAAVLGALVFLVLRRRPDSEVE